MLAIACIASDAPDATSTITTIGKDKDGDPLYKLQTFSRENKPVLRILKTTQNKLISRSYFVGGKLVMSETDEDGDGICETIALYRPGTDDVEIYTRQTDGSVKPVSDSAIELFKQKRNISLEAGRDLLSTNFDDERAVKIIRDAQQKVKLLNEKSSGTITNTIPDQIPHTNN